jgi:hypothetical protein
MNFASALSDAELNLQTNGFSINLWVPEFKWSTSESEASQPPHPPQLLAALQIFLWFFIADKHRTWVHLAAEMQAGKTGVVSALIRLIFANASRLKITPERIFVLTGMSDNSWIKQTRERLPNNVRPGVFHNGGFTKVQQSLTSLAEGGELENILIIFDESHIASLAGNRPNNMIYSQVAQLCPRDKWEERNIHFLTISATDPAKSSLCLENRSSKVVRLLTNDTYQSVESLDIVKRIRDTEEFGDLHEAKAIAELKRAVAEYPCPLYHILRPRQKVIKGKKTATELLTEVKTMEGILKEAFPGCVVIPWDSTTKGENTDSSSTVIEDINELLEVCPERHTFILLKNMFYASKTMEDTHVGILWDRKGGKDDTNLQSLLGRALGYGKSKRTIVYTSKETVENYLKFWRNAIAGLPPPTDIPIDTNRFEKKMAGVQKVLLINGQPVITISRNYTGPGGTSAAPPVIPKTVPTVEEFTTLEELRARWVKIQEEKGITHKTTVRTPNKDENQFYTCALGKASIKQTTTDVREYICGCTRGWTSSARMADRPAEVVHRIYVGYENTTPIFFLRWGESKA